MFRHEPSLTTLYVTKHVPFYPTLKRQKLNFRDTFFRIILPQYADTGFNGGLYNFQRLKFSNNDQSNIIRSASAFMRGCCDLIQIKKASAPKLSNPGGGWTPLEPTPARSCFGPRANETPSLSRAAGRKNHPL